MCGGGGGGGANLQVAAQTGTTYVAPYVQSGAGGGGG